MAQWFEDESIWRDSYDTSFNSAVLDAAAEEVDQILELADFQEGNILDLACGPGRHAIRLAAKGYKVTGVDLTRCLLAKAQAAAGHGSFWMIGAEPRTRAWSCEEIACGVFATCCASIQDEN